MAAGTPLSAKNCKVRINENVHYATKWDIKPESALLDTSNFEGAGFETQIYGLRKCEITIEGWYDAGANPYDSPMNLQDGISLTNLKLYISGTSGPYWLVPSASLRTPPMTSDVKEKVMFRLELKANGAFYYPTGNAA